MKSIIKKIEQEKKAFEKELKSKKVELSSLIKEYKGEGEGDWLEVQAVFKDCNTLEENITLCNRAITALQQVWK